MTNIQEISGPWIGMKQIIANYSIAKSTAYYLLKEYEESGGTVIKIGRVRRVPESLFTQYLLTRKQ